MSDIDEIRADLEIISGLERISTKDVGISIGGKRVPLEACRERAIIRTIQAAPTLLAENDWLRKTNRTLADNLSSESMKLAQTIDEREQLKDLLSCVRVSTADNGFINVELVRRGAGKFRAMQRRLLEGSNDE